MRSKLTLPRLTRLSFSLYLLVNFTIFFIERDVFDPSYHRQFFMTGLPVMNWTIPSWAITSVIGLGFIGALGLLLERSVRCSSLVAWASWCVLLNLHPMLILPNDGYVGWALLALSTIRREEEQIPGDVFHVAWFIMGLSFFVSGLTKLASPVWENGEALQLVLRSVAGRSNFITELLLWLPPLFLKVGTWVALAVEFVILPLCFFHRGRRIAWVLLLLFHVSILATMDILSVTAAFLAFQLLLFDPAWVPRRAP